MAELFGAEIIWTTRENRDVALKNAFSTAWETGRRPYLIPLGGSTPVGALGYTAAFEEFLDQNVIHPDWIVVASSSGGTQAGLALGARRVHWRGKVLGISIDQPDTELRAGVADLASQSADRAGESLRIQPDEIVVNAGYLGGGYAVLGDGEVEAIRLFARHEGLLLDPVYTGRAAAGMIDLIRKGFFKPDETVLFWHTGGTPALFADGYRTQLTHPA